MIDAVVDTTVILHLFRKYAPALDWFNSSQRYGITSITWLEAMRGASSKSNQEQTRDLLKRFDLIFLTSSDQQWAIEQLERFHFSHRIGMNDCLIASVVHRLKLPLYTHNIKHMKPLLGNLAVLPYA